MNRLNMATSDDTILRRLKQQAGEPVGSEVRVLGVDEWAWSKGQRFGTILVDLEEGQVVDVLGESSAEALAVWLAAHPEITTVSRDRQGKYADGARRAIPGACASPKLVRLYFQQARDTALTLLTVAIKPFWRL